jgi:hypothetical protein
MMHIFGIDEPLPDAAFSTGPFHCGFVDTHESQAILDYQRESLEDYYERVRRKVRFRRFLLRSMPIVRRAVVQRIVRSSPFMPADPAKARRGRVAAVGASRTVRFVSGLRRVLYVVFGVPLHR